jgi:hypothetical protein
MTDDTFHDFVAAAAAVVGALIGPLSVAISVPVRARPWHPPRLARVD